MRTIDIFGAPLADDELELEREIEELEQALENCAHQVEWLNAEQRSFESRRRVLDNRIEGIKRHIERLEAMRV